MGSSGRLLGPSRNQTEGQDGSKLGPKMEVLGSKNEAKRSQENFLGLYAKLVQRLRTIIFPLDLNDFLRFRVSMLGGQFGLGVSWSALGASWKPLGAS